MHAHNKDTMYVHNHDDTKVLFSRWHLNRSHILLEVLTRTELELCRITSLLNEGGLHGERLEEMTAHDAGIERLRERIANMLYQHTLATRYHPTRS